jgi:diguanylate cyclase (GGDEF)-like protein/putative nucleotidyltransferase with HDIG domain
VEPDVKTLLPSRQRIQKILGRRVDKLPPFPLVALRLLEITRDDSKSSADIARVVEADPSIAAKTLRIVNSAAYGALRQISSIKHAVVLLGALEIRSIALGVTLFETMVRPGGHPDFDAVFFWKHAIAMGALCRAMAETLAYPDPEEAYVAGLLHDIGKVIIDSYGRMRYGDFLQQATDGVEPLAEAEGRILGLRHDDTGAYFCNDWKMPERLICAILLHHRRFKHLKPTPDEALLIALVSLGDFITWNQGIGSFNGPANPVLSPEVETVIDVERLDLQQLMTRMDREIQTTAEYYGFNFPSMENFRESLLRANIELGRENARHQHAQGSLKRELETITRLRRVVTQPHRSLEPRRIITDTLKSIQHSFRFDRVMAMKVASVQRYLVVIEALDWTFTESDLKKVRIDLNDPDSGFVSCLRQRVPVLINGRTGNEAHALKLLKSRELGIVAFSVNGKAAGVIAVDNTPSGRPLQPSDLSAVAIVANELSVALEKARTFEEIKTRATRDGLTNIYNRASLDTFLTEALNRARNEGRKLAVVMLDVDHFKHLNDTFGHTAGDSILKLLAGILTKFSRPSHIVGRYGGEEFLCILIDTDMDGAYSYAERIRSKVEDLGRLLAKRFSGYTLTISLGVAVYEEGIESVKALVDRADQAMYQAKESGRNRVMRYEPL